MANALLITLIGMGLVFVVILLLWGLMALLVRLTAEKEAVVGEPVEAEAALAQADERAEPAPGLDRKRRTAAAAVAAALALQSSSRPAVKPAGSLSAWQIVHRAGQARQRAR